MRLMLIVLTLSLFSCGFNYENHKMNASYPISIVYYDSLSQKELGDFPIDRDYYAQIIEILERQKPKYIILKFFFTEKSNNDSLLNEVLQSHRNILTQAAVMPGESLQNIEVLSEYKIASGNHSFPGYRNAWLPYDELGRQFSGIGFTNLIASGDVFKEFNIISSLNGDIYPSLPLLILQKEIGDPILIEPNELRVGSVQIPINSNGSFPVGLSKPNTLYKAFSFVDVLHDKVEDHSFGNNIVIIFLSGENAPKYYTGDHEARNVAEIVADAINSVLIYLD